MSVTPSLAESAPSDSPAAPVDAAAASLATAGADALANAASGGADLAFRPVRNATPRRLSAADVERYDRDGFVAPLPVFNPAEAVRTRGRIDRLLEQRRAHGGYAINCYQARSRTLWDLCTEPRILDVVEDLVGPDILCWASHVFCKAPHDPKAVPWHQDAVYWPLTPARTVTVWLAIDDVDAGNSAMEFLPGSHALGALEWGRATGETVLDREIRDVGALADPVSNDLPAGSMSLHADMLAHGSRPNRSGRRRCGLTIRYCPPEVRASDERWRSGIEAIVCRGEDRSGYWRHHGRPAGDDIADGAGPRGVGGN